MYLVKEIIRRVYVSSMFRQTLGIMEQQLSNRSVGFFFSFFFFFFHVCSLR